MTPYAIAWMVVGVAAAVLGLLVFRALRGFKWLRYAATALVVVWAATPFRFDDEHFAPAFAVAALRLPFVDESGDPFDAFLALGAATGGVVLAALLAMAVARLLAGWRSGRR